MRMLIVALSVIVFAPAQQIYLTNENYVACVTRADFDTMMDLASSGDKVAFAKHMQNSTCIVLKDGARVYRRNAKGLGVIQIRAAGTTTWLFTTSEAVREAND